MAQYEELTIDQGSTFKHRLALAIPSNQSGFDLSTHTLESHIRRSYTSPTTEAEFLVDSPQPSAGIIEMNLTDEQTAAMRPGRYVFDLTIESDTGVKFRVLEGIVTVTPSVTR